MIRGTNTSVQSELVLGMLSPDIPLGPRLDNLRTGELVVNNISRPKSRGGRSTVCVRVVGDSSFGWAEAAQLWGASIDIVVHRIYPNHLLRDIFNHPKSIPISAIVDAPPLVKNWNGIMLATVSNLEESVDMNKLFYLWKPLICIIAFPVALTRAQRAKFLPTLPNNYHSKSFLRKHNIDHGGVTLSQWVFVHLSRLHGDIPKEAIMTASTYGRVIQTALDDTVGRHHTRVVLEPLSEDEPPRSDGAIGRIRVRAGSDLQLVYDSDGLAPDIGNLPRDQRHLWVRAHSIRSPTEKVLRQITYYELLELWDYEGKLESKFWSREVRNEVALSRLRSPPAKMLRSFTFKACELLLPDEVHDVPPSPNNNVGLTDDISFSPLELEIESKAAAATADDALVDLRQWALPPHELESLNYCSYCVEQAREVIRRAAARWWRWYQIKKAKDWMKSKPPSRADVEAMKDVIRRIKATTYWTWTRGSRFFFHKIPEEWREDFRDGCRFWHLTEPPKNFMRNYQAESREAELATRLKIFKLKFQWYVEEGYVDCLVPRFSVVKVMENGVVMDIRVVWDCTVNGHNDSLWVPGFALPTFQDAADMVVKWLPMTVGEYIERGSPVIDYSAQDGRTFTPTFQGDVDVGAMFMNYTCHREERHSLGVRYIHTDPNEVVEKEEFLRFCVYPFGNCESPYLSCQGQTRVLHLVMRPPKDLTSAFQWKRVHLNLPFSVNYDPSLPRVILLRKDNEMATRQATFVDDIRVSGRGKSLTTQACRQLKSGMNSLGNQADDRKYRQPSTTPGAWKGEIILTNTPFPRKSTTSKKWKKFKDGLEWVLQQATKSGFAETAALRRIAGLGVNVTEVYPYGRCYLKGFFNAIESFRSGRDIDGWRLSDAIHQAQIVDINQLSNAQAREGYPFLTRVTEELKMHVHGLLTLFKSDSPLPLPLRPSDATKLRYFVADASAEGFGAVMQYPDGSIVGRDGLWLPDYASGGSNLREATAQVNHLLQDIMAGKHDGCEIWCGTDNAVWSAVWHKGMSSAKHLFELVVNLKVACHQHEVYLHPFHMSGDRMIDCGVDGLSRGNQDAGVSLGHDIRKYIPLNLGAFELEGPRLEIWCRSFMGNDFSPPLEPGGWYWEGHHPGVHIWSPPPAAALIALKELAKSRQIRPYDVTHVFLCPRLLWDEEWRRRFEKEMDLWFMLNSGTFWPYPHYEPLLVGISFPMSRSRPWLARQLRDEVVEVGRALSQLSKTCHTRVGDYLRQLWLSPRELPAVPGCVVR